MPFPATQISSYSARTHTNHNKHAHLDDDIEDDRPLFTTRCSRAPELSVAVDTVTNWLRNEKGKWNWPVNGADEVFPGLFLGDAPTALCTRVLKDLGITAVLNAAQGSMEDWNYVKTGPAYYQASGIDFFGVPAVDLPSFNLQEYFYPAADFIQGVLDKGGKVLVHCVQGISRSASLVLAYLMIKRGFTLHQAIHRVKAARSIAPNHGFLTQLIQLNDTIHPHRPAT